jgi:hypothetical protein
VVEGTCLENSRTGNGTEGSNPSLSARRRTVTPVVVWLFFFSATIEHITFYARAKTTASTRDAPAFFNVLAADSSVPPVVITSSTSIMCDP